MTRIDMTTREWHALLGPVLPHASTDKDDPGMCVVRVECAPESVIAIATDRYTLAAERHALARPDFLPIPPAPVHIRTTDAAASLKLFGYSKDDDPPLRITIDTTTVPVAVAGNPAGVPRLAVTLQAPDGTRLILHDHRDPTADAHAHWRKTLADLWHRPLTQTAPAMSLSAAQLARWGKSARKGERLCVYAGAAEGSPLLLLVEDHFAGAWMQARYLDDPQAVLAKSPWLDELPGASADEEDERPEDGGDDGE